MANPYRFTDIEEGCATVLNRATGEKIGDVQQRSKSYNLRRYYVYRWWDATTADTRRRIAQADTRSEAAQALLDHAARPVPVQRVWETAAFLRYSENWNRERTQENARRMLDEALDAGAVIDLPEGDLTASFLFDWCKAQSEAADA